jgi:tetratricopeptide (TPR) repeat protein
MPVSPKVLEPVRAELEERVLAELKSYHDQLKVAPEERRHIAHTIVSAAARKAVNDSVPALLTAFKRQVWIQLQSYRALWGRHEVPRPTPAETDLSDANLELGLASTHMEQGRHELARERLERARRSYVEHRDEFGQAQADLGLGLVHLALGDTRAAEQSFASAALAGDRIGLHETAGQAWANLGEIAHNRGDDEDARLQWIKALVRITDAGKRQEPIGQWIIKALQSLDA